MISEIQIENFKSIAKLSLKPGNVTVLIGENGSGKSNILEAIAFAAAASADKLDNEFLVNRGIRVTDRSWMQSAFVPEYPKDDSIQSANRVIGVLKPATLIKVWGADAQHPLGIRIHHTTPGLITADFWSVDYELVPDEIENEFQADEYPEVLESIRSAIGNGVESESAERLIRHIAARRLASQRKRKRAPEISAQIALRDFLIYAPENSVLRTFEKEGAIEPLGPRGEGLLKLLQTTAIHGNGKFAEELKSHLALLGWFGDLQLPNEADEMQGRVRIHDRWLPDAAPLFDQRSANEGFLYLLFYFTLFLSKQTPAFFAIDNIDNSLNPKLCSQLMRQIAVLAAKSGKQVICTTHNPAILDGMNLHDDQQRLYVVRRGSEGSTIAERVKAPRPRPDGPPVSLSTAFMSGMLGGLPDHF